jgi:hypothetical protein
MTGESEEIKDEIIKKIEDKYFLIPKHNWLFLLGGFIAILLATIFVSYQGAMKVVESAGTKIAKVEIAKDVEEIKEGRKSIDSLTEDIKNGGLNKEIVESLKSDNDFKAKIKGDRGEQGILTGEGGQYIEFKNSRQKKTVYIGSSKGGTGIIFLYDRLGNQVLRINNEGIFLFKNNKWVEPYTRGVEANLKPHEKPRDAKAAKPEL